ncbi:glycosyltransferase family 4 protein [Cellulosimicrobium sp. Marseille-Q8652]
MPRASTPVVLVNNSRETFTPTVSGAIATCLWEVTREAAATGVAPFVLTRPSPAPTYDWPRIRTVRPRSPLRPGGDRTDRAVRRLTAWAHRDQGAYAHAVARALRGVPPGTVVVCNNDPEVAVHLRDALPGARVAHWFHNLEVARDPWRRRYARGGIASVAVSDYLARAVEHLYGLTPRTVSTAWNGVDVTRFAPSPQPADRAPVVGFLGRLAVEKGPDVLLRALLELRGRGRDFGVQVLGDTNWGFDDGGPYGREVRGLLDALRARGVDVVHPGHVERSEVPRRLRDADLHVVPSRWDEPFGLTTLEGMASGLATVGTATGGTPEILGEAGILVARDSPRALAHALDRLVLDRQERERRGAAARARAEELTWDRTWARLQESWS